jgi:UDP-N-acetylglucosamine 1-carboxyvinyltransferase
MVVENIFENRFKHVPELIRMGAHILVKDRTAIIHGVPFLEGAKIFAKDLRGGAALVLAALGARDYTMIEGVHYIDRGYEKIEKVFEGLGAQIQRRQESEFKSEKENNTGFLPFNISRSASDSINR